MFGQPGEYVLFADGEITPEDTAAAKKLLGRLNDSVRAGGPAIQSLKQVAADGTTYVAMVGPGTRRVIVQRIAPVPPRVPETVLTAMWIPRGFVFVPGDASAPKGWGLPVQQLPGDSEWPFGKQNLAPGLEVSRWTAGGAGAQVLLTQDDTSTYPDETRKRLPIGFDDSEWKASMTWKPKQSAWHVTRPTFEGFDWTPKQQAARKGLWNACATKLTASLCSLPFAGFYDDAQVYAGLIDQYGTNEATWPTTYKPSAVRGDKDGHRTGYSEAWYLGGTAQQLADLLSPIGTPIQLDAGISSSAMTVTLRTAADWIRCGNVFWHPDDSTLPTLSWMGYPAQNLPFWLVEGGWVGDTGGAIFPLEGWWYEWRGETRYVYGKNLYAMGRCIGVLPDTVIAAAIRKETVPIDGQPGKTKKVNRVTVMTWRADDQFGDANGIAYLWKFRVWCADFDVVPGVPLHVSVPPVGAYDVSTNVTGWRECGGFALWPANGVQVPTGLPDLTLWQMPRFNGAGTEAVAAYGIPPYSTSSGQLSYVCRMDFSQVAENTLDIFTSFPQLLTANGVVKAVDFAGGGALAYVWSDFDSYDAVPPRGGSTDAVNSTYRWSGGGNGEIASWAGLNVDNVREKVVLDARTGATAFLDVWSECSGSGGVPAARAQVRLSYHGVRLATDDFDDDPIVADGDYVADNFLDRLNASFACDRDGNYVMGYDLGVTEGSTAVYATIPTCGGTTPATTTASASWYVGSHWLFNGQTMSFKGLPVAPMRAFPIGVV